MLLASRPAVVCSFALDGELVPWSAPEVVERRTKAGRRVRGAKKNPHLEAFQAEVALRAEVAMGGKPPTGGPVELILWLWRRAPRGRKPGDWWDKRPEASNLLKGIEDALSGVVYADDRQVVMQRTVKKYGTADGCRIVVCSLAPGASDEGADVEADADAEDVPF